MLLYKTRVHNLDTVLNLAWFESGDHNHQEGSGTDVSNKYRYQKLTAAMEYLFADM